MTNNYIVCLGNDFKLKLTTQEAMTNPNKDERGDWNDLICLISPIHLGHTLVNTRRQMILYIH